MPGVDNTNLGLLALHIWGEIKAERYWDEFERELENRRLSS